MKIAVFLIRLMTFLNVFMVPIAILVRWFLKSKIGCVCYDFCSRIRNQFEKLNTFWKNFVVAFSIGIFSYIILSLISGFSLVTASKNMVFDYTLDYYTEFSNKEKWTKENPPILISVDEESYQNIQWITRDDKKYFQSQDTLQLVDVAFEKGSRHVFVDFDLSSTHLELNDREFITKNIQRLIDKYKDDKLPRHLFVVIPIKVDYCLPSVDYYHAFDVGIWEDVKLNQGNFFIHPVSPSFFKSSDQVVRHWNLFSVGRYSPKHNTNYEQWGFIPSPQLAYHLVDSIERDNKDIYKTIERLKQLSWLSAFETNRQYNIDLLDRSQFENHTYSDLTKLSNSNHLKSFCNKNSTDGRCIESKYTKIQHSDLDNIHRANAFKSLLANPNSEVCHDKIDEFVSIFDIDNDKDTKFENRIIYSMKSWYDTDTKNSVHYEVFTPIQLMDNSVNQRLSHTWDNRIVLIGANYMESRDVDYATPVGTMSGALINLNAIVSFNNFGAIGLLPIYKNILLNIGIILIISLVFARFNSIIATGVTLGIFALAILLAHRWLFEHGIWIEFGLPILVINIAEIGMDIMEWLKEKYRPKETTTDNLDSVTLISENQEAIQKSIGNQDDKEC